MGLEDMIFNAMVSEIGFEQAHRGMAQIAAKAVAAEIERLRAQLIETTADLVAARTALAAHVGAVMREDMARAFEQKAGGD